MAGKEKKQNENKKENKKKKGGGGILVLLLLLLLLMGGLGWGIGMGGFGGIFPGGSGVMPAEQKQPEQQVQEEPTPVEETEATDKGRVDEEGTSHVIAVGENGITFDGEAITTEALTEKVAGLAEGAEVVLKDEHAVVGDYSAVKEILDAANIVYTEEK